jgi:hypothetical protein
MLGAHMKLKNYTSEFTQFLTQLKKDNPDMEKNQQIGRSLLWDKLPINLTDRANNISSTVKQKPYVYSTDFDNT